MSVTSALERASATDQPTADYFERLWQSFETAVRATRDEVERNFAIGGHTVRLRSAGTALLSRLAPALEHLAGPAGDKPALTVALWDTASTGTALPTPPWARNDHGPRGEIRGTNRGRYRIVVDLGANTLSMFDTGRDLAFFWTQDAQALPYYESGAPLRTIIHWSMARRDRQFVHAGAIGTTSGGVLLAGRAGSGKSTASLACLEAGLGYAGDDYCLLSLEAGPQVYSLYCSAKLNPDSIARVPTLQIALSNADRLDDEKGLYFLHRHFSDRILTGFPLSAVLLPRVSDDGTTRLTPVSPATALLALAPSTLFQLPGATAEEFRTIARLLRDMPCYTLELGRNLREVADAVRRLVPGGVR